MLNDFTVRQNNLVQREKERERASETEAGELDDKGQSDKGFQVVARPLFSLLCALHMLRVLTPRYVDPIACVHYKQTTHVANAMKNWDKGWGISADILVLYLGPISSDVMRLKKIIIVMQAVLKSLTIKPAYSAPVLCKFVILELSNQISKSGNFIESLSSVHQARVGGY